MFIMKINKNVSNSTKHSSTTHCKDRDLSLYSNCHDGKGEGLFLSNVERPYPFPEDKLMNGDEVKLSDEVKSMYLRKPRMQFTFLKQKATAANVSRLYL